jgi:hypothetical protein
MIRSSSLALGLALAAAVCCLTSTSDGQQESVAGKKGLQVLLAGKKELQALLAFLKRKGVELLPAEAGVQGSYVQRRFTVGPDHRKRHVVGLNYLPPLTPKQARERYIGYSLPHEFHRDWALFKIGGPGGNASPEYEAAWKKALAALREYPGPAEPPGK